MNVRELLREYVVGYFARYLVYAGLVVLALLLLAVYTWIL